MDIQTMQQRYPKAGRWGKTRRGYNRYPYCVGGALCRVAGLRRSPPFPTSERVAEALQALNPRLALEEALGYATALTRINDQGRIAEAWNLAGIALAFPQQPGEQI